MSVVCPCFPAETKGGCNEAARCQWCVPASLLKQRVVAMRQRAVYCLPASLLKQRVATIRQPAVYCLPASLLKHRVVTIRQLDVSVVSLPSC